MSCRDALGSLHRVHGLAQLAGLIGLFATRPLAEAERARVRDAARGLDFTGVSRRDVWESDCVIVVRVHHEHTAPLPVRTDPGGVSVALRWAAAPSRWRRPRRPGRLARPARARRGARAHQPRRKLLPRAARRAHPSHRHRDRSLQLTAALLSRESGRARLRQPGRASPALPVRSPPPRPDGGEAVPHLPDRPGRAHLPRRCPGAAARVVPRAPGRGPHPAAVLALAPRARCGTFRAHPRREAHRPARERDPADGR